MSKTEEKEIDVTCTMVFDGGNLNSGVDAFIFNFYYEA